MQPLYYIPLQQNTMNICGSRHPAHQKLVMKGDVGVVFCSDSPEGLTDEAIRVNNFGVHNTWTIVEAEDVTKAIREFYSSYEAARFGGASLKSKALQIDRTRWIVKLPYCRLMDRYRCDSRFACGQEGMFGMCVLDPVADFPDGECAMKKFCRTSTYEFSKNLPAGYAPKRVIVDNIVYIFAELKT